jgi:purine-binding chemotaxis protein CheW
MPPQEDTHRTCIIVVQLEHDGLAITMGIIVDEVSEVVNVAGNQIEPPPSFGSHTDTGFVLGMGKLGDSKVVLLLNIDEVLSLSEMSMLMKAGDGLA